MSTQEIVQRLRATQPARFAVRASPVGGALVLAGLGLVGFGALRLGLLQHLPGRKVMAPRAVGPGPGSLDPATQAPATTEAAAAPTVVRVEAGGVRLSVRVRGAPAGAELRVDGATVGPATHWEGRLARGAHAVAVHSSAGDYAHVVQLQSAQEVVFELGSRRVHARKLHEHGHAGR